MGKLSFIKKYSILFLLLTFIKISSFAQDKGYLAFSFGPSFPVGNFGKTDINNSKSGLAETGTITDLSFAHRLGKYLGISAMLSWQANPLDIDVILADAKKLDPTIIWSGYSESWKLTGLLAGLYGSFPLENSTCSFEIRAMLGLMTATLPEYSVSGTYNGLTFTGKVNSQTTGTTPFLIGAGFRFVVGKKVCLLTSLDYMNAKAEFIHVSNTTNFSGSSNFDIKQDMETINLGFGIGLRL